MKDKFLLCEHCENNSGNGPCSKCKNFEHIHGREGVINKLKEKGLVKDSAKLRNIVCASETVLFKDLCKVEGVKFSLSNKVTTTEFGSEALSNHLPYDELKKVLMSFLTPEEIDELEPALQKIDYVYDCAGMVYGSSIHASGTLLSEDEILLAIDSNSGDCHINGHYAEEYGYIKYDLLSLGTLNPIVELMGMNVDWNALSQDRELMKYICSCDLTFVFQFGSPIVTDMIRNVPEDKINTISLSEITSINRPGALGIQMNETWKDIQNETLPRQDETNSIIEDLKKSGKLHI